LVLIPLQIECKKPSRLFLLSRDKKKFFRINIFLAFIFALLYYAQDVFICSYPKTAKKFKFIPENYDASNETPNTLLYYIWFSLVTQSTVGYTGIMSEETNEIVHFSNWNFRSSKAINVIQLISIFYVGAMFI
jgi:hypothetical protein